MYIYNPDNFDPSTLPIQLNLLTKNNEKELNDVVRIFLHILLTTQYKFDFKDRGGFVPLKALILKKQLNNCERTTSCTWKNIRQLFLVANQVIECDERYLLNEKCFWFRLGPAYRDRPIKRIFLDNDKLSKANQGSGPDIKNDAHEMMWHWLNQIELDYNKASERLQQEAGTVKNISMKWLCLEKLRSKDFFFNSDERGRVYHNIANMWSEFRQFLSIGDEPLVNIDIRNSQPLILAVKLKEDIINRIPPPYSSDAHFNGGGIYKDVKEYIDLVERGQIYDHLMSAFGYKDEKRSWFKKKFFAEVLYSECSKSTKLASKFTDLFPNVAEAICRYKEKDYRDLPLLMQKTEADLMIGNVCARIVKDYRHIPFLTIHDSVLTTPQHVQKVKEIIQLAFMNIGLSLTFG